MHNTSECLREELRSGPLVIACLDVCRPVCQPSNHHNLDLFTTSTNMESFNPRY